MCAGQHWRDRLLKHDSKRSKRFVKQKDKNIHSPFKWYIISVIVSSSTKTNTDNRYPQLQSKEHEREGKTRDSAQPESNHVICDKNQTNEGV